MKEEGTLGIYQVDLEQEDDSEPEIEEFKWNDDEELEEMESQLNAADLSTFDELEQPSANSMRGASQSVSSSASANAAGESEDAAAELAARSSTVRAVFPSA